MSTSKTITRTDLTNILNEVLPNPTMVITKEYANCQITWYSTSQPFQTDLTIDVTLEGYTPISFSYYFLGSGSSFIYTSFEGIAKSGNLDVVRLYPRMTGNTPSTTTQNTVTIVVTYIKNTPMIAPIADYIVEQGTSGIWTYRKWNSGIAECWGTTRFTDAPMTSTWGYGYYSSSVGRSITLPSSLFTSVVSVSVGADFHGGTGNWSIEGIGSTTTIGGYLWSTKSETRTVDVCLEVKGRWK